MKRILALAIFLSATNTHASELKFGDLNYFFKKGESNIKGDINLETEVYVTDTAGSKSKDKRDGYNIETQYLYAINDRLNAFAGLNYAHQMEVKGVSGSSSDYQLSGLSSPKFGANLRSMKQDEHGFNIDFGLIGNVKVQDSKNGVDKQNGNNVGQQHSLEFNGRLGKKWNEANEFYFVAAIVKKLDGSYDQKAGSKSVKVDVDGSMDYRLGAFYQYRPVNEFMTTLGFEVNQVGEFDSKSTGVKSTTDTHLDKKLTFVAKYLINENFIAKLNLAKGVNPDYDIESKEINRRRFRFIGVGLDYLF